MVAGISALQEKFELICEDGDLSTIEIVGLDRTLIDTLVTLELLDGRELRSEFRISIDGRFFSRDPSIPIGPGEHVIILDGTAGG